MIRVFLVDDHTVVRQGLRLILEDAPDMVVVGEAGTAAEALSRLPAARPDVVLLDIHLPDQSGVEVAQALQARLPETRIIILTVSERQEDVRAALQAGAQGYLLKSASAEDVVRAVRQVVAGGAVLPPEVAARLLEEMRRPPTSAADPVASLTPRERDVLRLMALGFSNKEIARQLGVSENTVKTHVRHILAKLNARSRVEAAMHALRAGLVPAEEHS